MRSPIKWLGGKSLMVAELVPLFPKHYTYVEVFGGAAWALFHKPPSSFEVMNDFDSWLINFWEVVKSAKDQFIRTFDFTLVSRKLFEKYKTIYKNNACDDAIERAHIFYYLVMAGFGADMKNPTFGTGNDSRSRLRLDQIEELINLAHKRIQQVTIENKSFEHIFNIYDGEETFFYLDSPYRNTKQYAVGTFTDDHYRLLADCCAKAKGKWLYTINDDPFIRELFKDFNIIDHKVYYSVCKTDIGRKDFNELIITNYEIPKVNQLSLF